PADVGRQVLFDCSDGDDSGVELEVVCVRFISTALGVVVEARRAQVVAFLALGAVMLHWYLRFITDVAVDGAFGVFHGSEVPDDVGEWTRRNHQVNGGFTSR